MADPTRLDYQPPEQDRREPVGCLGSGLMVLSLAAAAVFSYWFIEGLAWGYMWVIYPPDVPASWWLVPAGLLIWPVWFWVRWFRS
jgi:hypothetical protein